MPSAPHVGWAQTIPRVVESGLARLVNIRFQTLRILRLDVVSSGEEVKLCPSRFCCSMVLGLNSVQSLFTPNMRIYYV